MPGFVDNHYPSTANPLAKELVDARHDSTNEQDSFPTEGGTNRRGCARTAGWQPFLRLLMCFNNQQTHPRGLFHTQRPICLHQTDGFRLGYTPSQNHTPALAHSTASTSAKILRPDRPDNHDIKFSLSLIVLSLALSSRTNTVSSMLPT